MTTVSEAGPEWRALSGGRYVRAVRRVMGPAALQSLATLVPGLALVGVVFHVADPVLLRPLPLSQAERIVALAGGRFRLEGGTPYVQDWIATSPALSKSALYSVGELNLFAAGHVERVRAAQVSGDFFGTLEAVPALGRTLGVPDVGPSRLPLAVISDGLWRRCFGGRGDAAGSALVLGGRAFTVVGVMPRGFDFPRRSDVWVPAALGDRLFLGALTFEFIGRLAPGWSLAAAQAQLRSSAPPAEPPDPPPLVVPLQEHVFGDLRQALLWLQLAGLGVLTVAWVNVVHVQSAEEVGRRADSALRRALGATRTMLVRDRAVACLTLALLSGLLGAGLALAGARALFPLLPVELASLGPLRPDARVAAVLLSLSALVVTVAGLVAARAGGPAEPQVELREGSFGASPSARSRFTSRAFLATQVALATGLGVALVVFAGGYARVASTDTGLDPRQALGVQVSLSGDAYREAPVRVAWYAGVLDVLRGLPGVEGVGLTNNLPLGGVADMRVPVVSAGAAPVREDDAPEAAYRVVAGDYFRTMGIPLLAGRDFDARDGAREPKVAIVNERLARALWGGDDPAGRQVIMSDAVYEVVAVVGNVRHVSLERAPEPELYLPYGPDEAPSTMALVVRARGEALALARSVAGTIHGRDAQIPVYGVSTLEQLVDGSLRRRRLALALLACFAAGAVVLAALGAAALFRHSVSARRREFAVRLALGAEPATIFRSVLGEAGRVALVGVALGLGLGALLVRLLQALVPAFRSGDVAMAALVPALLLASVALAVVPSAWRAARTEPAALLRL